MKKEYLAILTGSSEHIETANCTMQCSIWAKQSPLQSAKEYVQKKCSINELLIFIEVENCFNSYYRTFGSIWTASQMLTITALGSEMSLHQSNSASFETLTLCTFSGQKQDLLDERKHFSFIVKDLLISLLTARLPPLNCTYLMTVSPYMTAGARE